MTPDTSTVTAPREVAVERPAPTRSSAGEMDGVLGSFFAPEHVVVVGASSDPARVGGRPIDYLQRLGYRGRISPVNPNRDQIAGLTCYPNVDAVPGAPDLALVALAGRAAIEAIAACGRRGIRAAIVFTAGFSETGPEGADLEAELLAVARREGVRLCGPNTLGVISAPDKVTATFATCLDRTEVLEPGRVGLISQSGALGAFMHRECQLAGVPVRHFVATGNEADLTAGDYLLGMVEDPEVNAVGMYLEGIRDDAALIAGLERARELGKPVCILKVGRSERAALAAAAHTGAPSGPASVEAELETAGALLVDGVDDVLAFLTATSRVAEPPNGGRVGFVSVSGGFGVWAADVAAANGVEVPDLDPRTREELDAILPGYASSMNPVDVTGQIVNEPELVAKALELVAAADDIDIIVVGLGIQDHLGGRIARGIVEAAATTTKPILTAWMAGPDEAYRTLDGAGLPSFRSLDDAMSAVTRLAAWARSRAAVPEVPRG